MKPSARPVLFLAKVQSVSCWHHGPLIPEIHTQTKSKPRLLVKVYVHATFSHLKMWSHIDVTLLKVNWMMSPSRFAAKLLVSLPDIGHGFHDTQSNRHSNAWFYWSAEEPSSIFKLFVSVQSGGQGAAAAAAAAAAAPEPMPLNRHRLTPWRRSVVDSTCSPFPLVSSSSSVSALFSSFCSTGL